MYRILKTHHDCYSLPSSRVGAGIKKDTRGVLIEEEQYSRGLATLVSTCEARPELGVFQLAPTISHTIARESSGLFLAAAPVFMQLAHPYVAYALKQHSYSSTRGGLRARTIKTLRRVYQISFGTLEEVVCASKHVRNLHNGVIGNLEVDCGTLKQGQEYRANDKDALQWVLATTIEYVFLAHEMFIGHLSTVDKDQHYQFVRSTAAVWGLDPSTLPLTWNDFVVYYEDMVHSGILCNSPAALSGAKIIMPATWYQDVTMSIIPGVMRNAFAELGSPTLATLPTLKLLVSCSFYAGLRMVYRLLPQRLRQLPAYSQWRKKQQKLDKLGWMESVGVYLTKNY